MSKIVYGLFLASVGLLIGTLPSVALAQAYTDETPAHAMPAWSGGATPGSACSFIGASIRSRRLQGKQIDHIGEWIMLDAHIPVAEYRGFAADSIR